MKQLRLENLAMTFDEVSMERSKSFVKALQELKNLRPQLYSAAEYCENSYLHSEQKQMVLDNLKDYAVRALVNAVDHLGTVAYKLTDLFEQQTFDVSIMEQKVSRVNQQLFTCQTYTDREGLRQQQLLKFIPRHHKHYILPNSVNKKVHFSPQIQTDARQAHIQARARLHPSGTWFPWWWATHISSLLIFTVFQLNNEHVVKDRNAYFILQVPGFLSGGTLISHRYWYLMFYNKINEHVVTYLNAYTIGTPASKTLSWHLASETKSTLNGTPHTLNTENSKASGATSGVFHRLDAKEAVLSKSPAVHLQSASGGPASSAVLQIFGVTRRESVEGSKPLTAFRSFNNPTRHEIIRAPVRSKSMLSAFFVKHKSSKPKTRYVS